MQAQQCVRTPGTLHQPPSATPADYLAVLALEHTNAAAELHSAGWRPSWPRLLSLAAQLASAVAHVHAAGYVHRDIKPANLLLDEERATARLADLGLAAHAEELAGGGVAHAKPTGGFHKQHMVRVAGFRVGRWMARE